MLKGSKYYTNIFRTTLVLLTLMLGISVEAQRSKMQLASEYSREFNYIKAAEIYEDVIRRNPTNAEAMRKAVDSYMKVGNTNRSEQLLSMLCTLQSATWKDTLDYSGMLKMNGKFEAANMLLEDFAGKNPDNTYIRSLVASREWIRNIYRDSTLIKIFNSPVNSAFSDFAPNFFGDKILFSSARNEGVGKRNIYAWNEQSYLNLFECTYGEDSALIAPVVLGKSANSRYHEGSAAYDSTNEMIYFTRNHYNKGIREGSKEGYLNLAIYYGSYKDGEAGKLQEFRHNNPEYSVGHPTLNSDGTRMYFTSDMPGGMGYTDIFVTEKDSTGNWGPPQNMGDKINTPGSEMFPFILNDSTLYFTSNGMPGMGGYDLYFADVFDGIGAVSSMGYPINTGYDDFALIVGADKSWGYLSSNRPNGKGSDDIYYWTSRPPESVRISGFVFDLDSGEPVGDVQIALKDSILNSYQQMATTQADGTYSFDVDYDKTYTVLAIKSGYFKKDTTVRSNPASGFIDDVNIGIRKYDFTVRGKVLYADNDEPAPGAEMKILDETGNMVVSMLTDEQGKYQLGVPSDGVFTLFCNKDDFAEQRVEIITKDRAPTVLNADFRLFKLDVGVEVRLDNIYYDFDKWNIRPDAEPELNRLVSLMEDNPDLTIELSSHTDCRGSSSYNQTLSKKRARSAVDYIIAKGINKSRITSAGYGESQLLNKCKDGVKCTEEEHQLNRRTVFRITGV